MPAATRQPQDRERRQQTGECEPRQLPPPRGVVAHVAGRILIDAHWISSTNTRNTHEAADTTTPINPASTNNKRYCLPRISEVESTVAEAKAGDRSLYEGARRRHYRPSRTGIRPERAASSSAW